MCGVKFRRQHPIDSYIVDFYSHEARLVIEVDGGQHNEEARLLNDAERTTALEAKGIRVLRFWNHEVLAETDGVLECIREVLEA